MRECGKLLIILVLGLALCLPAALAEQSPPYYPVAFWINGTLARGAAPNAEGYKVVLYNKSQDPAAAYALNLTTGAGEFRINALDDLRLWPLAAGTYYLGVVNSDPNGYGVKETQINITQADLDRGYINFNLELKLGEGITDPEKGEVPAGTVKLYISRGGSDINVTWETTKYGTTPQLFVRTGDGRGVYTNTAADWTTIESTHIYGGTAINVPPGTGRMTHVQQFGVGVSEAYYKGLMADIPFNDYYIASAEAVGKVNYTFVHGNNYFNYPFVSVGDANSIFGKTGYPDNCQILTYQKSTDDFSPAVFSAGAWQAVNLQLGVGYIFYNSGDQLTTTLVGTVSRFDDAFSANVVPGNNYIGLPLAGGLTLSRSFGSSPAANDSLLTYQHDSDDFSPINCLSAGSFANPDYRLVPRIGYVYYRSTAAPLFPWNPRQ